MYHLSNYYRSSYSGVKHRRGFLYGDLCGFDRMYCDYRTYHKIDSEKKEKVKERRTAGNGQVLFSFVREDYSSYYGRNYIYFGKEE